MRPVHPGQRHVVAEQAAADFQRGEVPGDHDHAAATGARGLEVFEPFDAASRGASVRPNPTRPARTRTGRCRARRSARAAMPRARRRRVRESTARGCVRRRAGARAAPVATRRQRATRARVAAAMAGAPAGHRRRCPARPASARAERGGGWRRRHADSRRCRAVCRHVAAGGIMRSAAAARLTVRVRYPVAMRPDPIERLLRGLYSAALYVLAAGHRLSPDLARLPPARIFPALERALCGLSATRRTRRRCGCMRCPSARSTPRRRW